jgi:hypothetical protein
MAANGHSCPATPSYVQPRNTWPDGTSSLVWHHPATPRPRLTVKQVYKEFVPGSLTAISSALQSRLKRRGLRRYRATHPHLPELRALSARMLMRSIAYSLLY